MHTLTYFTGFRVCVHMSVGVLVGVTEGGEVGVNGCA